LDSARLKNLINQVATGSIKPDQAMEHLKNLPFEDLGFAKVDHHRTFRKGFPEVIYGEGKTAEQIQSIARAIHNQGSSVLVTRVEPDKAKKVQEGFPELEYHQTPRCLTLEPETPPSEGKRGVAVVAAGTSDLPVAEEAALTARLMGSKVRTFYDVGVAGIHRLLASARDLGCVSALVVVAGMEGALPSVVAGLVDKPVIAVPTSVGYGTAFGGLAALLGMLNSCASGLSVV
jgi:NCAIR mutase (PurE)-related protein